MLLPPLYHNPRLDLFQIFYTLLTSLNVRISRGLEEFHSLNLAESALVTRIRKDDWSRAAQEVAPRAPAAAQAAVRLAGGHYVIKCQYLSKRARKQL